MFETLFTRPTALARHRAGPLRSARARFLTHCAAQGHTRAGLQRIAWLLLVVAHSLRVDTRYVSVAEIERAARRRARFWRRPTGNRVGSSTQQPFVHVATTWLRFLGRLVEPTMRRGPFASQIDAFAQ